MNIEKSFESHRSSCKKATCHSKFLNVTNRERLYFFFILRNDLVIPIFCIFSTFIKNYLFLLKLLNNVHKGKLNFVSIIN